MSTSVVDDLSPASTDTEAFGAHVARVEQNKQERRSARAARDARVRAVYPHHRTFEITAADPVGPEEHAVEAKAALPRTLTLITP